MKKFTWLLVGVMVLGIVFGTFATVNAATFGNGQASKGNTNGNGVRIGTSLREDVINDVAQFLGITVEQIQQERLQGKSLATIATEHGKTEDALIQYLVSKKTAYLKDLLAQGKITQLQYDNALQNITSRTKQMVERTETGKPSFAGNGSSQRRGNGFRGNCPNVP